MEDITSHFVGFDVPQWELIDGISRLGWEVSKIEAKPEGFIVKVKSGHEEYSSQGKTPETALAKALLSLTRLRQIRSSVGQTWTHMLPEIALDYAKAPIWDVRAAPSWKALADDSTARANEIKKHLAVEYTHEPVPYPEASKMAKDIRAGKIKIPIHDVEHPVWTPSQVLDHRLAHAVLGKAPTGGADNWVGVNQATAHHMPYLSSAAKQALFTENIGKKAYQTQYSDLGHKKICHLKGYLDGSNIDEGEPIENTQIPWLPKVSSLNKDWESNVEPPWPNAFILDDPLHYQELLEEANRLHTGWEKWQK